MYLSVAIV